MQVCSSNYHTWSQFWLQAATAAVANYEVPYKSWAIFRITKAKGKGKVFHQTDKKVTKPRVKTVFCRLLTGWVKFVNYTTISASSSQLDPLFLLPLESICWLPLVFDCTLWYWVGLANFFRNYNLIRVFIKFSPFTSLFFIFDSEGNSKESCTYIYIYMSGKYLSWINWSGTHYVQYFLHYLPALFLN